MTSQIAIFNPLGVAVASDTVATLTNDRGTKTQNNAEKMWPLTEEHRVVIALNNSFSINGVPASLLISAWNSTLKRPLPTLLDYVNSFKTWLQGDQSLIHPESDFSVMNFVTNDHFGFVRQELIERAQDQDLADDEIKEMLIEAVHEGFDHLNSLGNYEGVRDSDDRQLLDESPIDIEKKVKAFFEGFPGFNEVKQKLINQAALVLSREQVMGSDTNLTFIGFGENDYFASSIEFRIRGRYGNVVRGIVKEPFPNDSKYSSGHVTALAQNDAILGFMYGAEDRALDYMKNKIWEYIVEKHANKEEGFQEANAFLEALNHDHRNFSYEVYVNPLLRTVEFLNLSDAAEFAESLVGIQAMRAKASPHPAGVGGFIESLVIDKFSGVRWIKRLPK
jgi:hypothetical protein